jgi:anti-anti-sigma factor
MHSDGTNELAQWFDVRIQPTHEATRLQAVGELDLAAVPMLRTPAAELLDSGVQQLVIDLREVTFIDVSAVRLLTELAVRAADDGRCLSVIEGSAQVRRMLALTEAGTDGGPATISLGSAADAPSPRTQEELS